MLSSYSLGEIIWAKMKGYAWWPGRVKDIYNNKPKKRYLIDFFGDNSQAILCETKISKFKENYTKNSMTKKKKLLHAINLADTELKYNDTIQSTENKIITLSEKNDNDLVKNELLPTDVETKEEKQESEISFAEPNNDILLNNKRERKELDGKELEEELINKIVKYFLYVINLMKKNINDIIEEKDCIIKVLDFLFKYPIDDIIPFLEKTNLSKLVKYIMINIENLDRKIFNKAKEVYSRFKKMYFKAITEQKENKTDEQ